MSASDRITPEMMTQYSAIGQDLRFYADQRLKIAGAFLVANGLLANVANDHQSGWFALLGIALGYFCLSWDYYTSRWWWALTKTLIDIEQRGILEGTCITAYGKYPRLRAAFTFSRRHPWLRAGQVMQGIYLISMVMWAGWCSYVLVVPVLIGEVVIMCRVVRVDAARG